MLAIIDKLVIAFIYVNVLFPRMQVVPGLALGHALVALLLLSYGFHGMTCRTGFPLRAFVYIAVSLAGILGLSIISLSLGNEWVNVSEFVKPTLILLLIPVFFALCDRYSLKRYASHILTSTFLLAAYIAYLYWQCAFLNNRELAYRLTYDTIQSMIAISYIEDTVRICVVTGGFLPAGLLLSVVGIMSSGRWYYHVSFVLIAFALYVSQTWGLWLASSFACATYLAFARQDGEAHKRWLGLRKWLAVAVLVGCAVLVFRNITDVVLDTKRASVSGKARQTQQALEMFAERPFFGAGLGYVYNSMKFDTVSGWENMILESSYPMILSSTGLAGVVVYAFVYLFYVILCGGVRRLRPEQTMFLIAHASILVAGIGNPYIWSGGMGLFYLCFLAVAVERERAST